MTRDDRICRKKVFLFKAVGVIRRTKSPATTGKVNVYEMGKTRTGKPISSHPSTEHHAAFSPEDHADAYLAHTKILSTINPYHTHPSVVEHHKKAMDYHFKRMGGGISKSFSLFLLKAKRKHRVAGRLGSGKIVYVSEDGASHPSYKNWSNEDHKEAMSLHHRKVMRLANRLHNIARHKKGEHEKIQYLLKLHAKSVHGHHKKSRRKGK